MMHILTNITNFDYENDIYISIDHYFQNSFLLTIIFVTQFLWFYFLALLIVILFSKLLLNCEYLVTRICLALRMFFCFLIFNFFTSFPSFTSLLIFIQVFNLLILILFSYYYFSSFCFQQHFSLSHYFATCPFYFCNALSLWLTLLWLS